MRCEKNPGRTFAESSNDIAKAIVDLTNEAGYTGYITSAYKVNIRRVHELGRGIFQPDASGRTGPAPPAAR
jgi:hypothetical protein